MPDGKEYKQYRAKVVTATKEFADLENLWNGLLCLSQTHNYFLRWEWAWNWWQVYAKDTDKLNIIVIEKGAETVAIAPLYIRKKFVGGIIPIRQVMLIGTQSNSDGDVCSPYMSVICKAGEEDPTVEFIFKNLADNKLWDEIYLPRIDTSTTIFAAIQNKSFEAGFSAKILNQYESPYIQLPATWDDYLVGLSGSMRWKIRRQRKKLEDVAATFLKVKKQEELDSRFAELIALHQRSWETRGYGGAFSDERFVRFHHGMMREMIDKGNLELVLLYVGNEPKAALYNIIYDGTTSCYQSGTDRSGKNIAFGYLLHSYCIEDAIKGGRKMYDFLPEGYMDDYKRHFANRTRTICDLCLVGSTFGKVLKEVEDRARSLYGLIKSLLR
jgi:CelD/BcsL family acetyltransferase involved in cellulose biosynthesis